jgi:hypothetical protein
MFVGVVFSLSVDSRKEVYFVAGLVIITKKYGSLLFSMPVLAAAATRTTTCSATNIFDFFEVYR